MAELTLPETPSDVLQIPSRDIPEAISELLHQRRLSPLLANIHEGLRSPDDGHKARCRAALDHLGFAE
ncbi:hypothetical protein [Allosediminivita pacifica]|uniref:Uncharacterized protein n=1 Tax=Allosediminivita pacifica TaxID=1267769 RepID=A0A2T6BA24_9RHOB|nr:hypothetical protein [Allosediminivita pacifica]PTX52930.1 hypothetical protein C8N44_101221 [Allosediminivita pacifica]GGA94476.1 hypothetical protein GCM10011324_01240 [Allosediminivita pacifica]